MEHPVRLVSNLQERIQSLETEFHRAWWDSQVDAGPENERRRSELEIELRRVKGDAEALRAVLEALHHEIHDPILRRQLEVLRLSLIDNQMDDSSRELLVELESGVESDFNSYRPVVDGQRLAENEIEQILKSSNDEDERRRAWAASKEVGAVVADRVRELARIRNQVARDLGYADYYRMSLDLQELPEDWLFSVMDELEELTDEPFRAWKSRLDASLKERFSTDTLMPWHYADPFFQEMPAEGRVNLDPLLGDGSAPDLARQTFAAWGVDIGPVLERSDLYPRERKSQHAFCLDVDRSGKDVRILANVVPGERWIEVMLHESGHAAYDVSIDKHLPYLLRRPTHIFVTEAIALLSGRLVRDPEWLSEVAGRDPQGVAEITPRLRASSAAQKALFARWGLVMVHFEREFYADPEGDLDSFWWELVERFQLVRDPGGRGPDWAAKIHVAVAPVYYQNYLLGELLASQLDATLRAQCGGLAGVRAAGDLLNERVFQVGSSQRWGQVVEGATGRRLSAKDFAASLG